MEFNMEIDSTTGKTIMKPKGNSVNGQKVEVIIDPKTGKQTIRIVQEKPSEKCRIKIIKSPFFFIYFGFCFKWQQSQQALI